MAAERRCARCNKPLPAGAGKSTTMCSDTCRTARIRSAIADRRRSGPIEMSWPSAVEELTRRLVEIEIAIVGLPPCDSARRELLSLQARQLSVALEAMKQSTMAAEVAA